MTDSATTAAVVQAPAMIRMRNLYWVFGALVVMATAIISQHLWFLNFVHVFAGLLWTGTDLFMGFVLGPILRRLDLPTRRAVLGRLMPRTLFYLPTLAMVTTTSGWYLARQMGFLNVPYPYYWWLIASYVIVGILTVQGFGILLPINLRVNFELQKEVPDPGKIQRLMRTYIGVVAAQGVMQVAIVIVMSRIATGM